MQWKANESTWKQPETGSWAATCIRIIDLGTQEREYQGKTSYRRQSLIIWEIDGQTDDKGEPITISKAYTASLGEKANLRKDLECWRGRPFTSDELAGFDVRNLLGKSCLLNLIKVPGQKGEKVVIASIGTLPKGMPAPAPPVHSQYIYSLDNHDSNIWDKLSDGLKNWINRSQERTQSGQHGEMPSATSSRSFDTADDIPF